MEIVDTLLANQKPFGLFPDIDTDYGLDIMADTQQADKVIIYIDSTLDQAITVQAIAHRRSEPRDLAGAITVGGSITIAAGSTTPQNDSLTINLLDNWHPNFGVQISTGGTAPTAGVLSVLAKVRLLTGGEMAGESSRGLNSQLAQLLQEMAQTQAAMNQAIQELLQRPAPEGNRGLNIPFLNRR